METEIIAVQKTVQAGPYDKDSKQSHYIVAVEPFHVCFLGTGQKQRAADHHENGNTESEQRIIGIGGEPAKIRHVKIVPELGGYMKNDNAERGEDTQQVIVNHAVVVCLSFHEGLLESELITACGGALSLVSIIAHAVGKCNHAGL